MLNNKENTCFVTPTVRDRGQVLMWGTERGMKRAEMRVRGKQFIPRPFSIDNCFYVLL